MYGGSNPPFFFSSPTGDRVQFREQLSGGAYVSPDDVLVGGPGDDQLLNGWNEELSADGADGGSGRDICVRTRNVTNCEIFTAPVRRWPRRGPQSR
jgi:hypothetical protein